MNAAEMLSLGGSPQPGQQVYVFDDLPQTLNHRYMKKDSEDRVIDHHNKFVRGVRLIGVVMDVRLGENKAVDLLMRPMLR